MEGLGAEVTQKIKSAIQAKLMELGAYVDDELPDYVMVMVGNKRSKTQMENDLQLFLGNNTIPFTSWLYQVLQKLQEVTVASKSKNVKPIKKERTPSLEDDDFINIAETDGDLLEDETPSKRKQVEKTVKTKTDKSTDRSIVYLPSKIKDRKTSEDNTSEKKVEKVNKETNTVVKKQGSHDEISVKKTSVNESIRSSREETSCKKEDNKKKSSRSPGKERSSDKVIYDARELLNRKKAEKLASKDSSKQNDQAKKKREHSPDDRHSSKRSVSRVNDADALNRWVNVTKDVEQERNGRDKDSALKSTVHRTALKRKVSADDKSEDRSDRYKDDKRSDNSRSSKVIRISETLQAEQELIKPRNSTKTVISGSERKSLHSRIAAPPKESNRETERDRERESGVSSVVRITPRPKRPASQQPSSSLILKAVAEANKSLAAAPARPLPSLNRHSERPLRGKISPEEITVTLPNHRVQPLSKDETSSYNTYSNFDNKTRLKEDGKELDKDGSQNTTVAEEDGGHYSTNASCSTVHSHVTTGSDKGKVDDAINQWLKGVEEADPMKPVLESFSSQETDLDSEPVLEICQNMSELEPEEEPEFVVTLHGLDPDMFPKVNENEDDDIESDKVKLGDDNLDNEDNGLLSEDEEVNKSKTSPSSSPKEAHSENKKRNSSPIIIVKKNNIQASNDSTDALKLKSLERCKYWPSCLLGDKCSFHHPSTMCKTFPACKYGDNCLFIHPPCKFGISCTRRDCPYMHGAPVTAGIPKVKVNPLAGAVQYCRFYPNCTNLNCQFYHPKPCRFGRYCTKKDCPFEHNKGPSKDKLKWTRVQTLM